MRTSRQSARISSRPWSVGLRAAGMGCSFGRQHRGRGRCLPHSGRPPAEARAAHVAGAIADEPAGPVHLASPSGLAVQVNANGSIRRIDLPRRDPERVPRQRDRGRAGQPLPAPPRRDASPGFRCSVRAARPRCGSTRRGLARRGRVARRPLPRCRCGSRRPRRPGSGTSRSRTSGAPAVTLDLIHAQDVALADYGAVRLNEYYVSQYVDHTPLAHAARGVVLAVAAEPLDRRPPSLGADRLARARARASPPTRSRSTASRTPRGRRAGGARGDEPARRAPPARALAGRDPGRSRAARAGRARRARLLRLARARSPGGERRQGDLAFVERALALPEASPPRRAHVGASRRAAPATTLFASRPLLAARDLDRRRARRRSSARSARAVERDGESRCSRSSTARTRHVVLRGQGAREPAAARPDPAHRASDSSPTRRRSPRPSGWAASSTRCSRRGTSASTACSRRRTATSACSARTGQRIFVELGGRLAAARRALGLRDDAERRALDLPARAAALLEVRSWAAVDRHELWLAVDVLAGPPRRFLISNHLARERRRRRPTPCPRASRATRGASRWASLPDTDLGRRFPDGGFRFDPAPGTRLRARRRRRAALRRRPLARPALPRARDRARPRSLGLRITGRSSARRRRRPRATRIAPRGRRRGGGALLARDDRARSTCAPAAARRRRATSRRSRRSCPGSRTTR